MADERKPGDQVFVVFPGTPFHGKPAWLLEPGETEFGHFWYVAFNEGGEKRPEHSFYDHQIRRFGIDPAEEVKDAG